MAETVLTISGDPEGKMAGLVGLKNVMDDLGVEPTVKKEGSINYITIGDSETDNYYDAIDIIKALVRRINALAAALDGLSEALEKRLDNDGR